MITVHVWQPGAGGIGHASATVSTGGGEYVSWWPGTAWHRRAPGVALTHYSQDVGQEGRGADWTRSISGVNEALGIKWWQAFKGNANSCYSAAGQNCSWAVATFLKACGCDSKIGWLSSQHAYNVPEIFLAEWGQAARLYLFLSAKGAGNPQLSDYADNHTWTWTPTDIVRYVNSVNGRPAEEGLLAASKVAAPRMGGRDASKKVRKI